MTTLDLSAADAIWIATALLHQEHADRRGFTVKEILERVAKEQLTTRNSMTLYQHANQHCVANRAPNAARLRMLLELPEGLRRLYRDGDPTDSRRTNSRSVPERLPEAYRELADWYARWSTEQGGASVVQEDDLGLLAGSWHYGDADAYVEALRAGWE